MYNRNMLSIAPIGVLGNLAERKGGAVGVFWLRPEGMQGGRECTQGV
jgi:hypothetical protein